MREVRSAFTVLFGMPKVRGYLWRSSGAVVPSTWTWGPHYVPALCLRHNRWREALLLVLGAQPGDPTTGTGPCTGATKLWDVDVTVFLKVVL